MFRIAFLSRQPVHVPEALAALAGSRGGGLARGARVPGRVLPAACGWPRPGEDELRLRYVGPLERADGVQELVRAAGWLERDDWRLTLAGADTRTGTLATSMRAQLELEIEGDGRIGLRDEPGPGEAVELIRAHDVVVVTGRWGGRPEAIVDALAQDRPVLATPAGSNAEVLGGAGWLADGETAEAIAASLDRLLERREPPACSPRSRFDEHADPEPLLAAYADLATPTRPARRPRRGEQPLVSVVVPYFEVEAFVEETFRSIREQTYARLELLLVNDGSFREEDRFLDELAARYDAAVLTQPNRGVGAARNFGAAQSRGRYLCFLDSDNVVLPAFVERCVDLLEERPELGYATTWIRYVDEAGSPLPPPRDGYQPLSNECSMLSEINTAGDATALVRRGGFDAGSRRQLRLCGGVLARAVGARRAGARAGAGRRGPEAEPARGAPGRAGRGEPGDRLARDRAPGDAGDAHVAPGGPLLVAPRPAPAPRRRAITPGEMPICVAGEQEAGLDLASRLLERLGGELGPDVRSP